MLKPGDKLPDFELLNQNNNWVSSRDWIGKPVIIYFYPKNNTPLCTSEACSFRNQFDAFRNVGAQVIGISTDSPESHAQFIKKYSLPFNLLSDADRSVESIFGLERMLWGLIAPRVTFIFDKNGILTNAHDSRWTGSGHVTAAIEALKK